MLSRIINFSIKNKFIVLLFTAFLVGIGLYSFTKLSVGSVPDITNNQVQIITTSPHLSTQEIEQFITYPIEMQMTNIPGVEEIRSISRFGLSVVTIVFEEDMGTYLPRQLIAEKLDAASEFIPEGFGVPEIGPITTGLGEIYQYTLEVEPAYKDRYSLMELRSIQDWIVNRYLAGIPGVVEVNSWGGQLKEYEVALQPNKLNSMGVSTWDVLEALEKNNSVVGAAYIERNQQAYFIRGEGLVQSLEDIEDVVVENREGTPILIRDVAEVGYGHAVRFGAVTANGEGEKVMGQLLMMKGENAKQVVDAINERVEQISDKLPEGVYINDFLNADELIKKTSKTVAENLIIGILIVVFVIVLLIGNMRSGMLVASVIPLSLLFTLTMMHLFKVDVNLMSMGAIDFGIILDGAVIIVEYITYQMTKRAREFNNISKAQRRKLTDEISFKGSSRMMNSAIFGQLIILLVFIPILSLSGVEGKMFKPMALTFCFALIGAMILCFTYVPAVAAMLLRPQKNPEKNRANRFIKTISDRFEPIIYWALHHRGTVILIALAALLSSVIIFRNLGGEFIPTLDEGDYVIQPVLKTGTSLSETIEITTEIEKILLDFPEVEQVVSRIGAAEVPTDPMSMEESDIMISLRPIKEWTSAKTKEELAEVFEEALSVIPGMELEFSQPIEMRFNELITGVQADIAVKIHGEDLKILNELAQEVKSEIEDIAGIGDIVAEKIDGLPEMNIQYNRKNIAKYGMNIADLNKLVNMAFAGHTAGQIFEGEKRFNLVARFDEKYRNDIQHLENLYVDTPSGTKVPLRELATISYQTGAAQISRENTFRQTFVGVNVRNRDLQSVADDIQARIKDKIHIPAGYEITYGGQFENLQKAKARLLIAVPIALLLIFILLYFAFKSIKEALIIYTAIPLAAVGGVYFLWLRDMPFSISAGVGFIALFGIAVLNGIILVDYFKHLQKEGETDPDKIVILGTKSRLRAILLTASSDALGFLPMMVSVGAGAEVQRPLATVVIGGLITATLLTLIVLPVLYAQFCLPKNNTKEQKSKLNTSVMKPKLISFLILFFGIGAVYAQTPVYNLSDMKEKLLENNLSLQIQNKQIQQAETSVKTAINLDKTEVYYEWDESNTDDFNKAYKVWGLQQEFKFPSQYTAARAVRKAEVNISQLEKDRLIEEKLYQLETAHQSYLLLTEKLEIYQQLDSLYSKFDYAASKKFELGESTYLEKLTASSKAKQLNLSLESIRKEQTAVLNEIKNLLQIKEEFKIAENNLEVLLELPEFNASQTPTYQLQAAKTERNQQELKLNRRELLPDFSLGYFQSNNSNLSKALYGYQVGLKIPLFFGAQKNEVRMAKMKLEESELSEELIKQSLFLKHENLDLNRAQKEKELSYYQEQGNQLSAQLLHLASRSYEEGEIDFLQYVQTLEHAGEIQMAYLEALYEYNQIILELTYNQY